MMRLFFLACILVGLAGCALDLSQHDSISEEAEDSLVGGTALKTGEYRGVGFLEGGCTITRVGPAVVALAAHCVQETYVGKALALNFSRPRSSQRFTRTVQEAWLPSNVQTWESVSSVGASGQWSASDFAILRFDRNLPTSIPIYPVSLSAVQDQEIVRVFGSGCEGNIYEATSQRRMKSDETLALEAPDLSAQPNRSLYSHFRDWTSNEWEQYRAHAFATPGLEHPTLAFQASALCPGDSGGPVLRTTGGRIRLVGINTSYAFAVRNGRHSGVSSWNFHTRVHAFGEALRSLGVQVAQD